MTAPVPINVTINGEAVAAMVEPRQTLADFLRDTLQLTGTHVGCEHGVCGACTVRWNGKTVRGCLVLAVQTDGTTVETIEGVTETGEVKDLQDAFVENNALQCGFCTPGMVLATAEFLDSNPSPTREDIREAIGGNYCRCTGYQSIVDAVDQVAVKRRETS